MADWRKIETAIEDFFRRKSADAARAGGDLVIAVVHVDISYEHKITGDVTTMSVDANAKPEFIMLTDLAKELEDVLSKD